MIAPRLTLVYVVLVLAVVLGGAYAFAPGSAPLLVTAALLAGAAAAADALGSMRRLEGISLVLPDRVRLTAGEAGVVAVTAHSTRRSDTRLQLAPAWPDTFAEEGLVFDARIAGKDAATALDLGCRPLERGRFALDQIHLQTASHGGLWWIRRRDRVASELRVYPNLAPERTKVAALFLHRGPLGAHAQRTRGKGREFEKLREYAPGDSFEDIHWKATAKRSTPITKEYQIERTQEVYVVIDASRSLAAAIDEHDTPTGLLPETQLERLIKAALVLGTIADMQHDKFGLAAFSDKVDTFVRAGGGVSHHRAVRDALYTLQAKPVNPDFANVCSYLRYRLRRRSLIYFLVNLENEVHAERFVADTRALSRQHVVLATGLQHRSIAPLFAQTDVHEDREAYARLAGHLIWKRMRETARELQRQGVTYTLASSAAVTPELVSQYMRVKQGQLL